MLSRVDFIICIGGDGTILYTASLFKVCTVTVCEGQTPYTCTVGPVLNGNINLASGMCQLVASVDGAIYNPNTYSALPHTNLVDDAVLDITQLQLYSLFYILNVVYKPWSRGVYVAVCADIHLLVRSLLVIFPESRRLKGYKKYYHK